MAIGYRYESDVKHAKLPDGIKAEFKQLFERNLSQAYSRTRHTSSALSMKTQRLRTLNMLRAITELFHEGKFQITSLHNLREKHIQYLVGFWVSQKQARGTIENKITYLSTLCSWLGKANTVKETSSYTQLDTIPRRSGITREDKSWVAHGVDVEKVIAAISLENIYIGIQLLLQRTFALRGEESMLLRPYDCVMRLHGEIYLNIFDGTKNGLPRRLEVTDESKLKVIEIAKSCVNRKSGTTIPDQFSKNKWLNKYAYILRKHGVTKRDLGVTAHGLRHQCLNELFEELTGSDSPVRGGAKIDPLIEILARQTIAKAAGHSAISKANAYIGSHSAMQILHSNALTDDQIKEMLTKSGGNKMKAAYDLRCSRSYLYKRLREMEGKSL